MALTNEIVLRPRFKLDIKLDKETLLNLFEDTKNTQSDFIVSRVDDHVFIKIPKAKQHFWSPQLHLEINKKENDNNSYIYGLFGPNPTVWTMFMFLHFIVICLFFAFGVWAYTNWSLNTNYAIQLFVTLFMIVVWFALYFGGRIGKKTGTAQMHELHNFMRETLKSKGIDTM
ncbi:GTP-binding protein [Lacinutrix sp. C3R15]|uniref:GTP-binding protein n=1 Tax=Flavobacteriaceae TaxID=49546 RepID=UPI001C0A0A1D|nr:MULTISPECIES: GTP-binding protein [Flavobacteriaceae]MBU2939753.1 GTP-binding protein [Lacinutrix sp. C3R15]MDO6623068.1 GTP-binding protein [Oceanihabitans sp. 1_MG-2023]